MQGVYSVAYAPLGIPEGRIEGVAPSLKEKPILEVAEATGRSPAQARPALSMSVQCAQECTSRQQILVALGLCQGRDGHLKSGS